ncbi:hypothetical protein CTEN210_15267 [Chaetoceros tenuissimus]|uniref:Coenzyme Q-binding protein COQ10 START domain-containing protein n=1 Tax=Chaetoceros tenuissimus TaxID=426638 RepID=A0AAD3D8U2_9STRA|nr:hypothetical protein CTEN210_15267 [Chaetoceros tenuissimus]
MIPKIFTSNSNPIRHRHIVNKIVKTSPQHLFGIVTDVDAYKSFLPFCKSSEILRRSNCGTMFDASLKIGVSNLPPLNVIEEEYVSRVKYHQENRNGSNVWIVNANSIRSNLFHSLSSSWQLTEYNSFSKDNLGEETNGNNDEGLFLNDNGNMDPSCLYTLVKFEVEMSVSDPIISTALDKVLENVANQQVAAFERRCKDIPMY